MLEKSPASAGLFCGDFLAQVIRVAVVAALRLPPHLGPAMVPPMRAFALILALTFALPAAAEVYRWVDENGVVHYTDKPPAPGAEPAKLPKLQKMPAGSVPEARESSRAETAPEVTAEIPTVKVVSPTVDQTFRGASHQVQVVVSVNPGLAGNQGLIYYLDGQPVNTEPTRAQSMIFNEVYRGAHLASVAVVAGGKELSHSDSVPFYMMPPTVPRKR